MPDKIITLYCFFDELLKALGHKDDAQAKLSTAEVMTIAAVAAEFFTGNQQKALDFLISHGYIAPFSKSRFNRPLHAIPEVLWQFALSVLAQLHQQNNPDRLHIVDSFPVPVCRNIAIGAPRSSHASSAAASIVTKPSAATVPARRSTSMASKSA